MRILNIFFLFYFFYTAYCNPNTLPIGLYHAQYKKGYIFKLDAFLLINKNKGYLNLKGNIKYSGYLNYTIDDKSNIIFYIPNTLKIKLKQYYSTITCAYINKHLCPVIVIKPKFLGPIKIIFKRCIR